jgi:hypothetical protein
MTRLAAEYGPGDEVEVRGLDEIMATLDARGTLDSLPFMPEMAAFCGRRFMVARRITKPCVDGLAFRRMDNTLTLEGLHCDGSAHDGCQKTCPILWKDAWLKPAAREPGRRVSNTQSEIPWAFPTEAGGGKYFCQSTEMGRATDHLPTLSFDRMTLEWRSKNVGLCRAIGYVWTPLVIEAKTRTRGLSSVLPVGERDRTPEIELNLQPGERVEVKHPNEIADTLDRRGSNRGLRFTTLMLPFCGNQYVVKSRVERYILEDTAEMITLKNTVILEDVVCDGFTKLGGCSRMVYHLWREAWLRRIEG